MTPMKAGRSLCFRNVDGINWNARYMKTVHTYPHLHYSLLHGVESFLRS